MSHTSASAAAGSQNWAPAWILSALFHATAIVLILVAIDSRPQGAAEISSGDIGIVLSDPPGGGGDENVPIATTPPAAEPPQLPEVTPPVTAEVAPTPVPTSDPPANRASTPRVAQVPAGGGGTGGGYGPGEGQASVRVFGVEGKGSRFVYVFDRSSSMDGAPLSNAKRQLLESLAALSSIHQFHIIFFNQQIRHFDLSGGGRRVAFATDRNKKLAERFVGGITADGGTDRLPALRAAIQMHPDVIFFLTDADDPMPASEIQEIADMNRRAGVAISTIEFGRGPATKAKNFLTELARITGGQYGYVDVTQLSQ
ncbi:MAG: hypothetical protein AB7G28_25840, partial [Pirellulales bacterium]